MYTEVSSKRDYSWGERAMIVGSLQNGIRIDGRSPSDYRTVHVELGVVRGAYGSARIQLGTAEVIAAVKAELRRCDLRHQKSGSVVFSARISPVAGRKFLGSAGETLSDNLVAVLDLAYSAPGVLNFTDLCLKEGTYFWLLHVDVLVLSYGGNLLDAAGFAVKSALFDVELPDVGLEIESDSTPILLVDSDARKCRKLDTSSAPVILTFLCAGRHHIVDPNVEEDACCNSRIVVAVNADGVTCVKKLGEAAVTSETIDEVLKKAEKLADEIDGTLGETMNSSGTLRCRPLGVLVLFFCFLLLYLAVFRTSSPEVNQSNRVSLRSLLAVCVDAAVRGGNEVRKVRKLADLGQKSKGKTREGIDDPVTSGDLNSHRAMYSALVALYPGMSVVSEEHDVNTYDRGGPSSSWTSFLPGVIAGIPADEDLPLDELTVWIDPLDATKEYTENLLDYVTTMVCVARNGRPIAGVVHLPFQNETYWAWVGKGHSRNLNTDH
ncbi:unnamed protein product, partial [Notodromas monacha]